MVMGGPAPLPDEYGFLDLEATGSCERRPPTSASACSSRSTALRRRGSSDDPPRAPLLTINIDHHHDNTRFGDVDLVVEDASSTGEVLADVFAGSASSSRPRSPRRSTRRSSPTRAVPVLEHDAEGAAARGRPRRGRGRRQQGVPERVRIDAVPEAEAPRAGARAGDAARRGPRRRLRPPARRLRGGRCARAVLGGDHRRAPRGRGRGARRAHPRAAERGGSPARKVSLRSVRDGIDVSAIARSLGRRRPPPGGAGSRATSRSTRSRAFIVDEFVAANATELSGRDGHPEGRSTRPA